MGHVFQQYGDQKRVHGRWVGRSSSDAKLKPVAGRTMVVRGRAVRPGVPTFIVEEVKKKVAGIEAALAALSSVGATEGPWVQFL